MIKEFAYFKVFFFFSTLCISSFVEIRFVCFVSPFSAFFFLSSTSFFSSPFPFSLSILFHSFFFFPSRNSLVWQIGSFPAISNSSLPLFSSQLLRSQLILTTNKKKISNNNSTPPPPLFFPLILFPNLFPFPPHSHRLGGHTPAENRPSVNKHFLHNDQWSHTQRRRRPV